MNKFNLLIGEKEKIKIDAYLKGIFSKKGQLILSNLRIFFVSISKINENIIDIKLDQINKVKKLSNGIKLTLKDLKFEFDILEKENIDKFINKFHNNEENEDINKEELNFILNKVDNKNDIIIEGEFPISLDLFYNNYIKDEGYFTLKDYYKTVNTLLLKNDIWDLFDSVYHKVIIIEQKAVNIPFRSKIKVTIKQQLVKNPKDLEWKLQFNSDAPYGDSFEIKITVIAKELSQNKWLITVKFNIEFFKFVLVKNLILTRSLKESQESIFEFLNYGISKLKENLNKDTKIIIKDKNKIEENKNFVKIIPKTSQNIVPSKKKSLLGNLNLIYVIIFILLLIIIVYLL